MPTRLAILGFAHGHVGMYCEQWLKLGAEQAQLVAGWDHDAVRARDACAKFGMAQADSAAELLARSEVDAVVIGAETSMHADLVEQAVAAGKAIVLQKPLCLDLAQADRIVAAVEKADVPFTLAWQMRVDEQNLEMRKLVAQGLLGRIYQVRRRHCLPTQSWGEWFENSWHVQPQLNRGMWADDAAHPIDWMLWMFGLPQSVSAEIATLRTPRIPDDNGIAVFRYPNGMMAEVSCSFTALAGENTTEIVGENGTIIQNYGDLVSCASPRPADAPGLRWLLRDQKQWNLGLAPTPASHGQRIAALAGPILEFLQGRRPPIATAREGRDVLRMTLACYHSARLGRRVALTESFDMEP